MKKNFAFQISICFLSIIALLWVIPSYADDDDHKSCGFLCSPRGSSDNKGNNEWLEKKLPDTEKVVQKIVGLTETIIDPALEIGQKVIKNSRCIILSSGTRKDTTKPDWLSRLPGPPGPRIPPSPQEKEYLCD